MSKTTMNNHDLEKLAYLLHILTEGHFVEGVVPNESAYPCAALAREYANRLRGLNHDSGMIDFYEMNPDFIPMMFPDDGAVVKQIDHLEITREMLGRPCPPPQHELMMMPTSAEGGHPVKPSSNGKRSKQLQ